MIEHFSADTELPAGLPDQFYIGGEWTPARPGRTHTLVRPDTEEPWMDAPLADIGQADAAVAAAARAFESGPWPRLPATARADLLRRLGAEIERRQELFARIWTAEVGAPISFARMFVGVAPANLAYYADLIEQYGFEDERPTRLGVAQVIREPVGVALLITPWNASLPILSYKLAAALAAGCTVVVKSSPETPLDGLLLADCARAVGFPPGVINVVTADREVGAHLVASPAVAKVSFTGSIAAGKQIGAVCLDRMARFTLELGGKSAAVLLDDVDLATTLPALAPLTMPFSGQICFSQTRLIVPRTRQAEIVEAYAGVMASLTLGDPWRPDTHLGPLATGRQLDRSLAAVDRAKADGARLVTGGRRSSAFQRGYYMEPTVFDDVDPDTALAREEVFGPVVAILAYDTVDDAVRLANDSDMGLSGTVFSADPERGYQVARRMQSGNVTVNGLEMAPNVPFGGYKQSGVGREGGPEGLDAFLEVKAVYRIGRA